MKAPMLRTVIILTAWTLTSFLSYYFAMMFLRLTRRNHLSYQSLNLLCLTGLQTILFLVLIKPIVHDVVIVRKHSFLTVVVCHVMASFSMNLCLSELNHPYSFVLKMMEPLPDKGAQSFLLGLGLTTIQFSCLPAISIGTLLLSFEAKMGLIIPLRTVLIFVANILIAVRNSVIKQAYTKDLGNQTCSRYKRNVILVAFSFFVVWFCLGLVIILKDRSAQDSFMAGIYLVTSSTFHVIFSYLSTAVVLKHMTVIMHAVTNLCRRLFVLGLLFELEFRTTSWLNYAVLTSCLCGLTLGSFTFRNENVHKAVVINIIDAV